MSEEEIKQMHDMSTNDLSAFLADSDLRAVAKRLAKSWGHLRHELSIVADRIVELEAEAKTNTLMYDAAVEQIVKAEAERDAALAEVERLRDGLEVFAASHRDGCADDIHPDACTCGVVEIRKLYLENNNE